jgi:hypothetical protein
MDAIGVCYLQYWLQDDVEQNFQCHFMLIKRHYCYESKLWSNFAMSPLILSFRTMNLQQSIFKCTIKINVITTMEPPFHVNPFIWLWWTLFIFWILKNFFLKFSKLVEIAIVQVLGNVKDEIKATKKIVWTFPNYCGHVFPTFLHAKFFPYDVTFEEWKKTKDHQSWA